MFSIHSLPMIRSVLAAVVLGLAVSGCGSLIERETKGVVAQA